MRNYQQKIKQILAFSLFSAVFSACNPVHAETAQTNDAHHAQNSLDWPGIYNGFTPCADCNGVKTSLALNKNNTYILITQYVGKSPREFVEKGKFTWGDQENVIVLTPRKSSAIKQYLVGEDKLTQLDDNGERISGSEANRYVLRRTDVTRSPQEHSGH